MSSSRTHSERYAASLPDLACPTLSHADLILRPSQLKPHCTSLLTSSPLTPQTLPAALTALHHINLILTTLTTPAETLTQSLISYIFFPITQLLQRNPPTSLPPPIREGILNVLAVLVRHWHGEGRMGVREQVWKMMIGWWKVGGLAEKEGGVKAWVACLDSIVRLPSSDDSEEDEVDVAGLEGNGTEKKARLGAEMKELVQRESFLPVLGETLSLLIGQSSRSLLLIQYYSDLVVDQSSSHISQASVNRHLRLSSPFSCSGTCSTTTSSTRRGCWPPSCPEQSRPCARSCLLKHRLVEVAVSKARSSRRHSAC